MVEKKSKTMKWRRYGLLLFMLLAVVSCRQEQMPVEPDGEGTVAARFRLAPEFTGEIEVKSSTGVNESLIKDVWVVQLNEGGTAALQKPEYITAVSSLSEVNVFLKRVKSNVYFIVNSHNDALFNVSAALNTFTAAKIEGTDAAAGLGMSLTDGTTAEALLTENGLPMSGKWTGTPALSGITQVSLQRAVAKVVFNIRAILNAGDAFNVTGVRMRGVPNTLQYYRDPASLGTGAYPAASGRYLDYPAEEFTGNLTSAAQSFTFYLPENRRGISAQTDAKQKNLENAPDGQGKYCTYVEISGEYTEGSVMAPVVYMIFLGENVTNDYNLLRNRSYLIETTIQGQNAVDTRVNRELDYTDNGMGMWFFLKDDLPNTYNLAEQQNGACPKGYYSLVNKTQAYMQWVIKPALASETTMEGQRISATNGYGNVNWGTNMSNGYSHYNNNKGSQYPVRCVRTNPASGTKYPYRSGNIITFRDANGGLKTAGIHPNWTKTPAHKSSAAAENKVAAKFEFSTTTGYGTWEQAVAGCVAPWRLPTQRELMMGMYFGMWSGANGNYHWSATEEGDANAWVVQFSVYNTGVTNLGKTANYNYRCVRDL